MQPLALVQQGVRLYLVCRFDRYTDQRILALPHIQVAEMREVFAYPADFDLAQYIEQGNFGILRGPQVRLSFRIEKVLGRHPTESPLSSDQQIVEDGGHLHITTTVADTELLHRWLRR